MIWLYLCLPPVVNRCVAVIVAGVVFVTFSFWAEQASKLRTQALLAKRVAQIEKSLTARGHRMRVLSKTEPKMARLGRQLAGLENSLKDFERDELAQRASALSSQVAELQRVVKTHPAGRRAEVIRFVWTNKSGHIENCSAEGYQLDCTVHAKYAHAVGWIGEPAALNEMQRLGRLNHPSLAPSACIL